MLDLQAEQKAIQRSNDEANLPLSWNQTRSMQVTNKVEYTNNDMQYLLFSTIDSLSWRCGAVKKINK